MRIRHKDILKHAFIEQPEPKPFKIKGYTKMNQADKVRALLKLNPDELDVFLKTMGAKKTRKGTSIGIKTLDNEVMWHVFAVFIKLRDADENGNCICFTSIYDLKPKWRAWDSKHCHAGHGISRRHFCTKYDERNVHAQSGQANSFGAGEQAKYMINIDKVYGEGTWDELVMLSNGRCSKTLFYFYEQIPIYLSKIKNLPNFKLL